MRDARPEGSPYPKADLRLRGLARLTDLLLALGLASLAGRAGSVLACTYLLLADGLHYGQSVGKRIFGVRAMVVPRGALGGRPAGYRESMMRNFPLALLVLFYVVPVIGWVMLFVVGIPVLAVESWMAWSDRLGVRIGDIFADTQVVDAKVVSRIEVTFGRDLRTATPPGPAPVHRALGGRAA